MNKGTIMDSGYYNQPEPDFDAMRRKFDKVSCKYKTAASQKGTIMDFDVKKEVEAFANRYLDNRDWKEGQDRLGALFTAAIEAERMKAEAELHACESSRQSWMRLATQAKEGGR